MINPEDIAARLAEVERKQDLHTETLTAFIHSLDRIRANTDDRLEAIEQQLTVLVESNRVTPLPDREEVANEQDNQQLINQAEQIIQRLENDAVEYGEHRLARFDERDAQILRQVLELAWQYVESSK